MSSNGSPPVPPPQNPPPSGKPVFVVQLPAGGDMHLQTPEEVEMWTRSSERYQEDYQLVKTNDLVLLGAILQQQVTLFRAQRKLNGMEPELDNAGVPTGNYKQIEIDAEMTGSLLKMLNTATGEIQKIEKALGIDKVTREAGGAVSVPNYVRELKAAAHERGIHITKRTLAYEKFANELRTSLRMLHNLDAEDRNYHNITPDKLLEWCSEQLKDLEEIDKKFAAERGRLYVGKL